MKKKSKKIKKAPKIVYQPTQNNLLELWLKKNHKSDYCVLWDRPSPIQLSFKEVKDFLALHKIIIKEHPVYIIFPAPSKEKAIELFDASRKLGMADILFVWVPKKGLQNAI